MHNLSRLIAQPVRTLRSSAMRAQAIALTLPLPQPTGILVPKPPGEAGHPKNGGYSLESTLLNVHHWPKSVYDMVNVSDSIVSVASRAPYIPHLEHDKGVEHGVSRHHEELQKPDRRCEEHFVQARMLLIIDESRW
jgi:hypothetical protein